VAKRTGDSYTLLDDDALASEYRTTGDRACIAELYRRFGYLVLGLSLKLLRQREDAEDAVTGIFIKLLDDLRRHDVSHFRSWLYVYTRNFCFMELRRKSAKLRQDMGLQAVLVIDMESGSDAHPNETGSDEALLRDALAQLGDAQQQCIRLFYLGSMSYAAIAKKTGFTPNEVKSHLQNGKRNLKLRLETLINERKSR
jgi:RNA polymerase sigma factor (sigma-70 family)